MPKIIPISGIIGIEVFADDIRAQLEEAAGEDIQAEVSSPGGLIFEGLEMFNLFRQYEGRKKCVIMGLAGSMASYLPLAFDEVQVYSNSVYFIHLSRAGIYGDRFTMREMSDTLEGLDNVLVTEYERKTGREKAELEPLFRKETYFYGQQIIDEGFADVLIDSEEGIQDEMEAVNNAKAQFYACSEKIKSSLSDDFQKIAAILPGVGPVKNGVKEADKNNTSSANSAKPQKKQEEPIMNWEEFIKVPENRDKFEALLGDAKKQGADSVQARIDAVIPYMGNENYAGIDGLCKEVLEGKTDPSAVKAAITAYDMMTEKAKADAAKAESEELGDTPADQGGAKPELDKDGRARSAGDMKAVVAQMNKKEKKEE